MPTQKEGREIPRMDADMITLLLPRLGYAPAYTPRGDGDENHKEGRHGHKL